MKKLLAVFVVSFLIAPFSLLPEAFSQDIWASHSIITTGIGNLEENNIFRAQNEAILDAQKKALIQAVGMLMTFNLLEEQFFSLREAVFNRPAYYIENYKVLYDSTLGDRYHITIQSTIAFKKLEDDLVTSQFLTSQVKLPRILLMVAQQKLEQSFFTCWWSFIDPVKELTITDRILKNELQKRGLEVIDHTYLIQENPLNKVYGCMDVKSVAIQTLGKQFNADIVIVGNSQVELTGKIEESHEKSVQANIIARAVKVEDGLTVAILDTYIPATEDNAETAQRVALERAASDLAHQMSEIISLRWTKESKGITLATLKISGLSQYLDFSHFKSDLKKEIPEIQSLSQKTLSNEGAIVEVESTLNVPSLAEQIRSKQFEDFTISIIEVSPTMIGMEVKIKSPEEEQPKTENKNVTEKKMIKGKWITLGVTGGIAAYKTVELVRQLRTCGAEVDVIMTKNAQQFVTPLTFQTVSGHPVYTELFCSFKPEISHISLAEKADAFIIAPATANIIAKIASGLADDLLSTVMLTTRAPVLIAPAMNDKMWKNPVVNQNVAKLKELGFKIIEPTSGELACGAEGKGRLADIENIVKEAITILTKKDLKGERILITTGPTHEPIDPVRILTNRSSGKMGFALAQASYQRGAEVMLVSGPTNLKPIPHIHTISVETSLEMSKAALKHYKSCSIAIKAAAVADYRPKKGLKDKMKKTHKTISLELERNPDILYQMGKNKGKKILVGFAAETKNLISQAKLKLDKKNLDLIVVNQVLQKKGGFGSDNNEATLIDYEGRIDALPLMSKEELADKILDKIKELKDKKPATKEPKKTG